MRATNALPVPIYCVDISASIDIFVEIELIVYPLTGSPRVEIGVNGNRLTCNAVGNPTPVISWKRPNGSVEVGAKHIYVDQSAPGESSGRYVCRAENDIGPGATAVVDIKRSKSLREWLTIRRGRAV